MENSNNMLSLFETLRNYVPPDSPLPSLTNELYLDRREVDLEKQWAMCTERHQALADELKPWDAYFVGKFRDYLTSLPPPPTFMAHLHNDEASWGKLYSAMGEKAFDQLVNEIPLYYRWDEGTYIQFSQVTDRLMSTAAMRKRKYACDEKSVMDKAIGRKRMFYSCHRKNPKELVGSASVQALLQVIVSKMRGTTIKEVSMNTTAIRYIYDQHFTLQYFRCKLNNVCQEDIVPPNKAVEFVHAVLDACVPPAVLLGIENLETFKLNIKPLITSATHRVFLVKDLVRHFQWPSSKKKSDGVILVAMWLAGTFVVELLRRVFICLESNRRKEPIFFKSTKWRRFVKSCKRTMFEKGQIEACQLPARDPRLASLIPLPKMNGGFRPLIRQSEFLAKNKALYEKCNIFLKQIVCSKRGRHSNVYSDLHRAWVNFTSKTKSKAIYFVKCDIKDAFGSINHKSLQNMLVEQTQPLQGKTIHLQYFNRKNQPLVNALGSFTELPAALPQGLYIPGRNQNALSVQTLVDAIRDFINCVYVEILSGKKTYKIVKGLPQGWKLSPILCDLYYSYVDDALAGDLYVPEQGDVFLRNVDDYVFISTDLIRCKEFYRRIIHGVSIYGASFAAEKTLTNVSDEIETVNNFVYFGMVLNPVNRTIQWDFDQYERNLDRVIALNSNMTWQDLEQRMHNTGLLKLHKALYDASYLSKRQIMTNLFFMSCVHALRYHFIVRCLEVNRQEKYCLEEKLLPIMGVSRAAASSLSKKEINRVTYEALRCVVLRGFKMVLVNSNDYADVLGRIDRKVGELKSYCGVRERKLLSECTKHCPSFVSPYF